MVVEVYIKVMRYRKGSGRMRKIVYRWKGKKVEKVKEFRYLGYVFQRNRGQEAHIRNRVKKKNGSDEEFGQEKILK